MAFRDMPRCFYTWPAVPVQALLLPLVYIYEVVFLQDEDGIDGQRLPLADDSDDEDDNTERFPNLTRIAAVVMPTFSST